MRYPVNVLGLTPENSPEPGPTAPRACLPDMRRVAWQREWHGASRADFGLVLGFVVQPLLPTSAGRVGVRGPITAECWKYLLAVPHRLAVAACARGVRPVGDGMEVAFPLVNRWHLPTDHGRGPTRPAAGSLRGRRCGTAAGGRLDDRAGRTSTRPGRGRTRSPRSLSPVLPGPRRAQPNYKNPPPEPADHALGRSRGGLSTEIYSLAEQTTATVQVRLTGRQAGDDP